MKTIQTSAIAVAALLVAVATAFALWADVLKIHIEVNTGNVDIEFGGDPTVTEFSNCGSGECEGKDVGRCTAEFVDTQDEEDTALDAGLLPGDWNPGSANNDLELKVTLSNAYPGYVCKVDNVYVENTGSVPVKLLVKILDQYGNVIDPIWTGDGAYIDIDDDDCIDFYLDYSSFFSLDGVQLHPGESQSFSVVVGLPIEHQACISEDTTYTFYVVIIGYQWNEFPS